MEPQERFVLDYFNHEHGLFFVDVGANDGVTISTTIHLERDYGWTGICVEPNPDAYAKLVKNRSVPCFHCGLFSRNDQLSFLRVTGYSEMLSGFECAYDPRHRARLEREVRERAQVLESILVPSRRLDDLLDEMGVRTVHYVGIDTEGSELETLRGIDFTRVDVKLVSVEDNFGDGVCSDYLRENGFRFLRRVCLDDFWARK